MSFLVVSIPVTAMSFAIFSVLILSQSYERLTGLFHVYLDRNFSFFADQPAILCK